MYCHAKSLETANSTLGISPEWESQQRSHSKLSLLIPQEQAPAWHPPATHSQMPKMPQKLMCSLGQSYQHFLLFWEGTHEYKGGIPWPTFTNKKDLNKEICLILLLLKTFAELWKNTPLQKEAPTVVYSNRFINRKTNAFEATRTGSRDCMWVLITRSLVGGHSPIILAAATCKFT